MQALALLIRRASLRATLTGAALAMTAFACSPSDQAKGTDAPDAAASTTGTTGGDTTGTTGASASDGGGSSTTGSSGSDAAGAGTGADAGATDGQSDATADAAGDAAPGADSLIGMVVDRDSKRPLAGRTVWVGDQSAMTGADGAFTLAHAPALYDISVVEPDGSSVSVYQGLGRRDPLLAHARSPSSPAASQRARIGGMLTGGTFPLGSSDGISLYFFSPETEATQLLGEGRSATYSLSVGWDGPDSITGTMLALRILFDATAGARISAYGAQMVTLSAGATPTADLTLDPATSHHVAGMVSAASGVGIGYKEARYRVPAARAVIDLPLDENVSAAFDYPTPDLNGIDGVWCVRAGSSQTPIFTERCGVGVDATDVALSLQAPPTLDAPAAGASIAANTAFGWTAFDRGIHRLSLVAASPSSATPNVDLYTSATSSRWPTAKGVVFARGASYSATISGLGPYTTIDDAVASDGVGAFAPPEARQSQSAPRDLTTAP